MWNRCKVPYLNLVLMARDIFFSSLIQVPFDISCLHGGLNKHFQQCPGSHWSRLLHLQPSFHCLLLSSILWICTQKWVRTSELTKIVFGFDGWCKKMFRLNDDDAALASPSSSLLLMSGSADAAKSSVNYPCQWLRMPSSLFSRSLPRQLGSQLISAERVAVHSQSNGITTAVSVTFTWFWKGRELNRAGDERTFRKKLSALLKFFFFWQL